MDRVRLDACEEALDAMEVAVMTVSVETGRLMYCNQKTCRDLALSERSIVGHHYRAVFWPAFYRVYEALRAACLADRKPHTRVYYWAARGIWEQVSASLLAASSRGPLLLLTITNITEAAHGESVRRRAAYFDPVLELPNWLQLEEDIRAVENKACVGVLHFDIVGMTNINAVHGWNEGTALLRAIREWLRGREGKRVRLYRTGDDEFCYLYEETTLPALQKAAESLTARFSLPWPVGARSIYCGVRVGIAYGPKVSDDVEKLLFRPRHGRNGQEGISESYMIYDRDQDEMVRKDLRRKQELMRCIRHGMQGFSVVYHPIVHSATRRWVGVEALCRWTSPAGEKVPPVEFIALVEEIGLIHILDGWVHSTAMGLCKAIGLTERDFFLDVNLSPTQQLGDELIRSVVASAQAHEFPRDHLTIEITESGKVDFTPEHMDAILRLTAEGFPLALDDFGTGYNSFEMLARMPVRVLKTERMFIERLETDRYQQVLMRMMVGLAHAVNMAVIAEGVETQAQWQILSEMGADYMQGYLFSLPLTAPELATQTDQFALV